MSRFGLLGIYDGSQTFKFQSPSMSSSSLVSNREGYPSMSAKLGRRLLIDLSLALSSTPSFTSFYVIHRPAKTVTSNLAIFSLVNLVNL